MTVQDELKKTIARVTHSSADDITPETVLKSIKADSLHWVQIIISAETSFNIEIDIERMRELKTFGELVSYVEGLAKGKA
jgi:acyl carrier protein